MRKEGLRRFFIIIIISFVIFLNHGIDNVFLSARLNQVRSQTYAPNDNLITVDALNLTTLYDEYYNI